MEKEAQAELNRREQLKKEQSQKDLSKLKEIEELEKQAQEAEEKSMALKVRTAARQLRGLGLVARWCPV